VGDVEEEREDYIRVVRGLLEGPLLVLDEPESAGPRKRGSSEYFSWGDSVRNSGQTRRRRSRPDSHSRLSDPQCVILPCSTHLPFPSASIVRIVAVVGYASHAADGLSRFEYPVRGPLRVRPGEPGIAQASAWLVHSYLLPLFSSRECPCWPIPNERASGAASRSGSARGPGGGEASSSRRARLEPASAPQPQFVANAEAGRELAARRCRMLLLDVPAIAVLPMCSMLLRYQARSSFRGSAEGRLEVRWRITASPAVGRDRDSDRI